MKNKCLPKISIACLVAVIFVLSACGNKNNNEKHEHTWNTDVGVDNSKNAITDDNQYIYAEESSDEISNDKQDAYNEFQIVGLPVMIEKKSSQILRRLAYVTSYNQETRCPNWVAWRLTREHLEGNASRKGVPYYDDKGKVLGIGFIDDDICDGTYFEDVEAKGIRQQHSDWQGNHLRMTHGHICPAGDNKWSKIAMNQSLLLTNMCPQTERSNAVSWNTLENKCRSWARRFGSIYIVAGPIFYNGISQTIGKNKIAVPDAFFKIVLRIDQDEPQMIGFIYPNDNHKYTIRHAACSVNEIEEATGLRFFTSINCSNLDEIKTQKDIDNWR